MTYSERNIPFTLADCVAVYGSASFTPDGSLLYNEGTSNEWHLLYVRNRAFCDVMVRVKIVVSPADDSGAEIYINHNGGIDVCRVSPKGKILDRGITHRLLAERHRDGSIEVTADFMNRHETVLIGASRGPGGRYQGQGRDVLLFKSIDISTLDYEHACDLEFIVAGHSHMFAMGASSSFSGPISLQPVAGISNGHFLMEQWKGNRTKDYWQACAANAKGRVVALIYNGNQHYMDFLLARTPLFDFYDPAEPDHPFHPDAVIVPRRMVKQYFATGLERLGSIISEVEAGGSRHVIVLGTPPVRADFAVSMETIRKIPMWQRFAERFGIDLATVSTTPPPIMKRLWGVIQEALADVAHEKGASFLPVPREAFNEAGYLAPQFRGTNDDAGHHNALYGRMMVEHVAQAVKKISEERRQADTLLCLT